MCFSLIVKGHIESLGENKALGIFTGKLKDVFEILNNPSFLNLDSPTALELIEVTLIVKIVFELFLGRNH